MSIEAERDPMAGPDEELLRLLAALRRPGTWAERDERQGRAVIVGAEGAGCRQLATLSRAEWRRAVAAGLVEAHDGCRWGLTRLARQALRRLRSAPAHLGRQARTAGPARAAPMADRPTVDLAESPLAWLRQRRGKNGEAMISDSQFDAGERLRIDYTLAQLMPRVTTRWSHTAGAVRAGPSGAGVELGDRAIAARERVQRALKAVGPELSGVLIDICCHLKGLEHAERSAGWPQRSGKVVLQMALTALARHYGLDKKNGGTGAGRIRHWGGEGFRPTLDGAAADAE
ncbi:MAG: DUF6456 domain-containing protein [Pseudomonadota bacterium]